MNKHFIHIAYLCVMLFLLVTSCQEQEDVQPTPEWVDLSISAAMATRADFDEDTNVAKEYELMHTLRIIIFDGSDKVEHNELFTFNGVFEASKQIFKVKKNETKTVYLLANCESFENIANEDITKETLDAIELTGKDGLLQIQENGSKWLPATAKYSINVGGENKIADLWIAHAANKISITYTNDLESNDEIYIHSWELEQIAQNSYLIPHTTDGDWYNKILNQYNENGGANNGIAVTNYTVPANANHDVYTYNYETPVTVTKDTPVTPNNEEGAIPIYLHESKYIPVPDSPNEQGYTISFNISKAGEEAENGRIYTAQLENLPSLFRSTYVKINVTIKALEEGAGPDGIYAQIEPWDEYPPTSGTIVPEDTEESTEPNP